MIGVIQWWIEGGKTAEPGGLCAPCNSRNGGGSFTLQARGPPVGTVVILLSLISSGAPADLLSADLSYWWVVELHSAAPIPHLAL